MLVLSPRVWNTETIFQHSSDQITFKGLTTFGRTPDRVRMKNYSNKIRTSNNIVFAQIFCCKLWWDVFEFTKHVKVLYLLTIHKPSKLAISSPPGEKAKQRGETKKNRGKKVGLCLKVQPSAHAWVHLRKTTKTREVFCEYNAERKTDRPVSWTSATNVKHELVRKKYKHL